MFPATALDGSFELIACYGMFVSSKWWATVTHDPLARRRVGHWCILQGISPKCVHLAGRCKYVKAVGNMMSVPAVGCIISEAIWQIIRK